MTICQFEAIVEVEFILIPLIGLLAFYLKGITGAGPTAVIISLSSLIIDPKSTIVLASFVNVFGGFSMLRVDKVDIGKKYWIPIAIAMAIGSVAGAALLKVIPNDGFQTVLGVAFVCTGMWFIIRIPEPVSLVSGAPGKADSMDLGVGALAGVLGGFVGVNIPLLVLHFGRVLDKRNMRRLLVLIYLPAAISQTGTFWISGLLTVRILFLGLLTLPMIVLGIWLGNKTFEAVSEIWFRRVLGILLIIISARLIIRSMI